MLKQPYVASFLLVLTVMLAGTARAQRPAPEHPSPYDRAWKHLTEVHVDPGNPVVQKVLFTGRFQYDFNEIGTSGRHRAESNVRRMRLGPKVTFLRTWTLHVEFDLNPQEHNPLYQRLTDAYVQWNADPRAVVTVGKQGVAFTLDGSTSSKELLTIDRSNLANNIWFPQEYIPGASLSGKVGPWVYRGGVYSGGEATREFGRFNGSWFYLGTVGYDFKRQLNAREALVSVNYVHEPANGHDSFTRQLGNVVSANVKLEREKWGLRTDVSAATGFLGQGDLTAVMVMPFYNVTPRLQGVLRYTRITSPSPTGVRAALYETRLAAARGRRYDETYVGANYYLYGHKLKLQTGLQWAGLHAGDGVADIYDGLSWTTGLRVGW